MGKAKILSGGDKGLYNIELVEHTARITSDLAKIDARLSLLSTAISDALAAKAIAEADYSAKRSALDTVIGQYIVGAAKKVDVDAAQNAYLASMKTLQAKTSSHSLLLQEQESKTKQKALLEAIPLAHTVDGVWCADLTEDLAAGVEVGTIEPNGEPDGDIIICPGGSADPFHQQLQPVMASTPAGWFLNMARFPGWQRWKPTFRVGTITALYSAEDYCDVTLDSALSSVQNLNITPSPALTRVPVEYLTCNCTAFSVGDRVVVQFTGQNWSDPKVIGFECNPKACDEYAAYAIGDGQGTAVIIIWNIGTNEVELGPLAENDTAMQEWLEEHSEVSGAQNLTTIGAVWDDSTPHKIDPDLVDPPDAGTWTTLDYTRYHDYTKHQLYYTVWFDWFPESAWVYNLLGSENQYVGIRTQRVYHDDHWRRFEYVDKEGGKHWLYAPVDSYPPEWTWDGLEEYYNDATHTYTIYGPLGAICSFEKTDEYHWLFNHGENRYDYSSRVTYFIPEWVATVDEDYTPQESYAKGRFWYGSSLAGKYTETSLAMAMMVQYTGCTYTAELVSVEPQGFNQTWEFGTRQVYIHALAAGRPEGDDWQAIGRNTALEAALVQAVEYCYSINGFISSEITGIQISVSLMR